MRTMLSVIRSLTIFHPCLETILRIRATFDPVRVLRLSPITRLSLLAASVMSNGELGPALFRLTRSRTGARLNHLQTTIDSKRLPWLTPRRRPPSASYARPDTACCRCALLPRAHTKSSPKHPRRCPGNDATTQEAAQIPSHASRSPHPFALSLSKGRPEGTRRGPTLTRAPRANAPVPATLSPWNTHARPSTSTSPPPPRHGVPRPRGQHRQPRAVQPLAAGGCLARAQILEPSFVAGTNPPATTARRNNLPLRPPAALQPAAFARPLSRQADTPTARPAHAALPSPLSVDTLPNGCKTEPPSNDH